MSFFWYLLGGFAIAAVSGLIVIRLLRGRTGMQPNHFGLVIMFVTMCGWGLVIYALRRAGIDIGLGRPRDVFWFALGLLWLGLTAVTLYQRRTAGAVLMDLGPNSMYKVQIAFGIVMAVASIGMLLTSPQARSQAVSSLLWAVHWFFLARGRFQLRDRGILWNTMLPWNKIAAYSLQPDGLIVLQLTRGLQRSPKLRVPADRLDEFTHLLDTRLGGGNSTGNERASILRREDQPWHDYSR